MMRAAATIFASAARSFYGSAEVSAAISVGAKRAVIFCGVARSGVV
jgi:hypothetical protein